MNVISIGSLLERLVVEVSKVSVLENRKAAEQKKENPDKILIVDWDKVSRGANEMKAGLINEIDARLKESIESGKYDYIKIGRTF